MAEWHDVEPGDALNRAFQIVNDAMHPRRFGDWIELIEDAAIVAYGDHAVIVEGLTQDNVAEHVRRIARTTLETLTRPDWLPPYLAFGRNIGSRE